MGVVLLVFPNVVGYTQKRQTGVRKKQQQLFKGKKINVELSTTPRVYYQVKVSRVVVV